MTYLATRACCLRARTLLQRLTPRQPLLSTWVQNVVRHIALLETSVSGIVHSSSYQYRDGLIHASSRSSLMSLAETLVHEASHQYFYLLSRLEPVDDGTDKNLYYSPFAGTE